MEASFGEVVSDVMVNTCHCLVLHFLAILPEAKFIRLIS